MGNNIRSKDIIIGNFYRLKKSPDYGYIKAIQLFKPREYEDDINKFIVKGEHTVNKNDLFGFIRYFTLSELMED